MATSRVNGVRLHREIVGDAGEPLVLVHGAWSGLPDEVRAGFVEAV